jgi:phosphatidylethanolamine-binding protein (PEBP) family uncharacterized protein
MKRFALVLAMLCTTLSVPADAAVSKPTTFQAEIWVDNWFALYINGKKVGEDSVPITTERSFNSEKIKFTATYPFTVGLMVRDFTENSSGLEYIGKPNQQIGDGGAIAQIRDLSTNKVIAATDTSWKTLVINKAPLNPECVSSANPIVDCKYLNTNTPSNWSTNSFKDTVWKSATSYTKEEVGVKDGYLDISWSNTAGLIWSSDLKLDNTVLIRKTISASATSKQVSTANFQLTSPTFVDGGKFPIEYTCDGSSISPALAWSGAPAGTKSFAITFDTLPGPPRPGETDSGKHAMFTLFNIPATATSIAAGNKSVGTYGQNFQGKTLGYAPPCSQGPGDKIYTFTIYALSSTLDLQPSVTTEAALEAAVVGKVLAQKSLSVAYARK